ncbi:MAG: hypothetical protein JKY46_04725 [Robiginitomaculum sp.]|nr:hypothetical protein [Robiginitomaculum sp.]
MAYRIVILTKQIEAPFLVQFIKNENPGIEVNAVLNESELRQQIGDQGSDTRLISFNSPIIIPKDVLDSLGPTAYNIHPGLPKYPGTYPVAFALKDHASSYGATAHEIIEKVDAGRIVLVSETNISTDISLQQLTELAFELATQVFSQIAIHCANSSESLPTIDRQWVGEKSSKKTYLQMCKLPANASSAYIANLRRICGDDLVFP